MRADTIDVAAFTRSRCIIIRLADTVEVARDELAIGYRRLRVYESQGWISKWVYIHLCNKLLDAGVSAGLYPSELVSCYGRKPSRRYNGYRTAEERVIK